MFSTHSQDFFHQSSFLLTKNCFINPASTLKILFHQSSFYLSNAIFIFLGGKRPGEMSQYVICSKKDGGRVCKYMHARAIYNVLTQGRTVENGESNPNPRQITPW